MGARLGYLHPALLSELGAVTMLASQQGEICPAWAGVGVTQGGEHVLDIQTDPRASPKPVPSIASVQPCCHHGEKVSFSVPATIMPATQGAIINHNNNHHEDDLGWSPGGSIAMGTGHPGVSGPGLASSPLPGVCPHPPQADG